MKFVNETLKTEIMHKPGIVGNTENNTTFHKTFSSALKKSLFPRTHSAKIIIIASTNMKNIDNSIVVGDVTVRGT